MTHLFFTQKTFDDTFWYDNKATQDLAGCLCVTVRMYKLNENKANILYVDGNLFILAVCISAKANKYTEKRFIIVVIILFNIV